VTQEWALRLRIRMLETDAEIARIAGRDVSPIHEAIQRLRAELEAQRG
jgi:hypothetical protein